MEKIYKIHSYYPAGSCDCTNYKFSLEILHKIIIKNYHFFYRENGFIILYATYFNGDKNYKLKTIKLKINTISIKPILKEIGELKDFRFFTLITKNKLKL